MRNLSLGPNFAFLRAFTAFSGKTHDLTLENFDYNLEFESGAVCSSEAHYFVSPTWLTVVAVGGKGDFVIKFSDFGANL